MRTIFNINNFPGTKNYHHDLISRVTNSKRDSYGAMLSPNSDNAISIAGERFIIDDFCFAWYASTGVPHIVKWNRNGGKTCDTSYLLLLDQHGGRDKDELRFVLYDGSGEIVADGQSVRLAQGFIEVHSESTSAPESNFVTFAFRRTSKGVNGAALSGRSEAISNYLRITRDIVAYMEMELEIVAQGQAPTTPVDEKVG
jgi:hypothetical protein